MAKGFGASLHCAKGLGVLGFRVLEVSGFGIRVWGFRVLGFVACLIVYVSKRVCI